MRKMAEIVLVGPIIPHPNADTLSIAQVHGWNVIIRTGEFQEGDRAVFFQQDAWVPYTLAPFLKKGDKDRSYNEVLGDRVRAIKLRGIVSNGILLPIHILRDLPQWYEVPVGTDVSEFLGIQKWEPPIPACLSGQMKGNFPSFIRKTDQTRIESCWDDFLDHSNEFYRIEHKMDGSSITIYHNQGELGVCSRNINLKLEQEGNTFVDVAKSSMILDALQKTGMNIAVQGELCGPGIQNNIHGLDKPEIFVFDIWDIDSQSYLSPYDRGVILENLRKMGANISEVEVIEDSIHLEAARMNTIPAMKKFVDRSLGKTKCIEGMVFKSRESDFTFKVINDTYLLKNG